MNDDQAFERAMHDWLDVGTDRTPQPAVEAVLLAIKTTPQERDLGIPWRNNATMSNFQRLAMGIAAVAVIAVAGVVLVNQGSGSGAAPTPSPTASPLASVAAPPAPTPIDTATWTPFTSLRHGYSARYPSGWALTPASAPATLADLTAAVVTVWDHFKSPVWPADEIMGVSTKVPDGQSQADWIAAYRQPGIAQYGEKCFPAPDQWKPISLDGHIGGLYVGCNYVEATTFVDGRAYIFTVGRPLGVSATAATEELLRAFLSTVTVNAAAADDTPVGG